MAELTWLDFHPQVRVRYSLRKNAQGSLRKVIGDASKQRLMHQASKLLGETKGKR